MHQLRQDSLKAMNGLGFLDFDFVIIINSLL